MSDDLRETVRYLITHPEDETSRDDAARSLYHEKRKSISKKQFSQLKQALKNKLDIESAIDFVIEGKKDKVAQSPDQFSLSDYQSVTWDPTGMKLVAETQGGVTRWQQVIKGYVKPIAKLNVDGDTFFEYELADGSRITKRVDELCKILKSKGMVFNQYNAMNVLSAISDGKASIEKVTHATFGVYPEDGRAVLCDNPVPIKEEQVKAWDQVAEAMDTGCSKDDLLNYVKLTGFWHPFEILANLGLAMIAPFTPILRQNKMLIPYVFAFSPESDTGKTTVAESFSDHLYGIESTSGPALESAYRFAATLDSCCLPITVNEGDRINPKLWAAFKNSAERWIADKRGTKDLGMLDYHSRAVLFITGNAMPITAPSHIKRSLIIRFDSASILERRIRSAELDKLIGGLKPIGYYILRTALKKYQTVEQIVSEIRSFETVISGKMKSWKSSKRPEIWGCVYFGLKMFENAAIELGADWRALSIDEFCEKVVGPIELSSWEMKRTPIEAFKSRFQLYMIEKSRLFKEWNDGVVEKRNPAEGVLYRRAVIQFLSQKVDGYWITDPLLDELNDKAEDELKITSLKELARQSADLDGLPYDKIMEKRNGSYSPKVVKFEDGESRRAAFIAYREGEKAGNLVTLPLPDMATNDGIRSMVRVTETEDGYQELPKVTNDGNPSQESSVTKLPESGAIADVGLEFYARKFTRSNPPILTFKQCRDLFSDRDWQAEFRELTQAGNIEVLGKGEELSFKWIGDGP